MIETYHILLAFFSFKKYRTNIEQLLTKKNAELFYLKVSYVKRRRNEMYKISI